MRPTNLVILVVDDGDDDRLFIQRAFRENGVTCPIHCASNGEEAMSYLSGTGPYCDRTRFPYPSFITIDLHMSPGDGFALLDFLQQHPSCCIIPTLVFSDSADPRDVIKSYRLGASAFLAKPAEPAELRRVLRVFYQFWMACEVPSVTCSGEWIEPGDADS
jgi:CheY-like chemotaxis protein